MLFQSWFSVLLIFSLSLLLFPSLGRDGNGRMWVSFANFFNSMNTFTWYFWVKHTQTSFFLAIGIALLVSKSCCYCYYCCLVLNIIPISTLTQGLCTERCYEFLNYFHQSFLIISSFVQATWSIHVDSVEFLRLQCSLPRTNECSVLHGNYRHLHLVLN